MWLFLAVVLMQAAVAGAAEPATAAAGEQAAPADESSSEHVNGNRLERLHDLNRLSAELLARASSGATPAHEFRIEARMYRELLRQAMLNNRELPPDRQLPQDLLLDMVRMSALLHSAAECKTGLVIVCPADLLMQLRSQQARVTQGLKMMEMVQR